MAAGVKNEAGLPPEHIKRDVEFSRRMNSACDDADIPPLNFGRQTHLREELLKRFNTNVSTESIRKWLGGMAIPRPAKMAMLAKILNVEIGWLQLGIDPGVPARERKVRNALADGLVNVMAGLIQMDGGHPAFPEESDKRAIRENVDLTAIIRGASYSFHVTTPMADDGEMIFPVPSSHESIVVLGVLREGFSFRVFEITAELIEASPRRKGVFFVSVDDVLAIDREIRSFANRP